MDEAVRDENYAVALAAVNLNPAVTSHPLVRKTASVV